MATSQAMVTSPLHGATVIRAPFVRDVRARLAACGAEPIWESGDGVWTMPRRCLLPVVDLVRSLFGAVTVAVELMADVWETFDVHARTDGDGVIPHEVRKALAAAV